jgi:hypothetical protein
MKLSWQTDADRLQRRWIDEEKEVDAFPYEAPWAHYDSDGLIPERPDVAGVSPPGHSEWRPERPVSRI